MLREFAFRFFLFLLPVPLAVFNLWAVLIYLFFSFLLFYLFKKDKLIPFVVLSVLLLLLSLFAFFREKKLEAFNGKAVCSSGIVLKQKQSEFETVLDVFFPVLKTYKGETLSFGRIYRVKIPYSYKMLKGKVVEVTGILSKAKVYKNKYSGNLPYLLSTNTLYFLKVKDRDLIREKGDWKFLRLDNFFLKPYTDIKVKAFLSALVFGNRENLSSVFRDKVKKLGIYHLFVLSGFHFGIFYFALYLLLFPVPLRNRYKSLIILLLLTVILLITSFSSPSLRVYLMLSVYLVFRFAGIKVSPSDAVGLAGILMLFLNPFNSFNPGFLMSFLISGGIVFLIEGAGFLFSYLVVPFVAFSVMLPFYFFVFNYLPVFSPFWNLLLIPLVVFIFLLFLLNIVAGGLFTGLVNFSVIKFLHLLYALPDLSFQVYPSFYLVFLFVFLVLFVFFYKKYLLLVLSVLLIIFFAFMFPPKPSGSYICFFDGGSPQPVLVVLNEKGYLVNTGDSYFSFFCLPKEAGFRGLKSLQAVVLEKVNGRILNKLDMVCNRIKVNNVVVCSNSLKPKDKFLLKRLGKFYRFKIIWLNVGKNFSLGNDFSVFCDSKKFFVKANGRTICFGDKASYKDTCFFVEDKWNKDLKKREVKIKIFEKCQGKVAGKDFCPAENGEKCFSLK